MKLTRAGLMMLVNPCLVCSARPGELCAKEVMESTIGWPHGVHNVRCSIDYEQWRDTPREEVSDDEFAPLLMEALLRKAP